MTKKLVILFVLLSAGFACTWLLPKSPVLQVSAMPGGLNDPDRTWELPHLVGVWLGGNAITASEKEIAVLAADTKFNKKHYFRNASNLSLEALRRGAVYEEVEVSVVTSGADMNSSIHRPERCLVAQGYDIKESSDMVIPVRGMPLPVRKLVTTMTHVDKDDVQKVHVFHNVTYYWFVGHSELTNDHNQRTLMDMKSRILKGYDQEWAYATVGLMLEPHQIVLAEGKRPEDQPSYGVTHPIDNTSKDANGLTEADRLAQEFIEELAKDTIDRKMIEAWNKPLAQL